MKGLSIYSKQRGFTLIEVGIALAIGLVIIMSVARSIQVNQQKLRISQAVTDVNTILVAAVEWRGAKSSYKDINIANLGLPDHLKGGAVAGEDGAPDTPATYGNDVNPWGGDYEVSAHTDANHLKIKVKGIPTAITPQLVARFTGTGQSATKTSDSEADIVFQ